MRELSGSVARVQACCGSRLSRAVRKQEMVVVDRSGRMTLTMTAPHTGASQFFDHRDPAMVAWLNGRKDI